MTYSFIDIFGQKVTVMARNLIPGDATLRAIKPGEEIFYDYGRDYLKNVIGLSNCQCSRCRKRRSKHAAELRAKRLRKAARLASAKKKARKSARKKSVKKSSKRTNKRSAR